MRIAAGAFLFLVATAQAQDSSPDKTIRTWMTERAKDLEKDFLPTVRTSADFEKMRPGLHQHGGHRILGAQFDDEVLP